MKIIMRDEKGFTLVELLIVVIILGVLAAVAMPQFNSSTDDAKLSTLDANLAELRNAVELYYHEHNSIYPGEFRSDAAGAASLAQCATSAPEQIIKYTTISNHQVGVVKGAGSKGPYIKNAKFPKNPFTNTRTVVCDDTNDITAAVASGGTEGWKFYRQTGKLIANSAAHVGR